MGRHTVIHGIDLVVRDGEFVVLVGPSGCGKSTLAHDRRARKHHRRHHPDRRSCRETISPRVTATSRWFSRITRSTASHGGREYRLRAPDAGGRCRHHREKVKEAADILRIAHLLDRKPGQLSGGQRQRVAMGRAIVRDPRCSCSTSRSRTSMHSCARRCASRSRSSTALRHDDHLCDA